MALLHPNFAARRPLPGALRHSQNHRERIARAERMPPRAVLQTGVQQLREALAFLSNQGATP